MLQQRVRVEPRTRNEVFPQIARVIVDGPYHRTMLAVGHILQMLRLIGRAPRSGAS
jgi:hypothetical protein